MSTLPIETIVHAESDGSVVIAVHGEIDMATAPTVEEHILAALAIGEPKVVVDLRGVTFIDSSGLTMLAVAQRSALQHGAAISLRSPSKRVLDLLLLTGLDFILRVEG